MTNIMLSIIQSTPPLAVIKDLFVSKQSVTALTMIKDVMMVTKIDPSMKFTNRLRLYNDTGIG